MNSPNSPKSRNSLNSPKGDGFTLAEMIIVIATMAIMAVIGTRTYYDQRDRFEFNNALTKTMQLIKTVRTYSITSYPVFAGGKNIIPYDGYGIDIKLDPERGKSTLTVFANVGPASNYQTDDFPNELDPTDIALETYTLPKQIDFKYFYFNDTPMWRTTATPTEGVGPTAIEAYIVFRPPLGELTITGKDKQSGNPVSDLDELSLQFENPASDGAGPKKCQRIILNRVKKFPELMYEETCL